MPRSFDLSVESSVSVEQVHWAFSQEDYWLARLATFGGIGRLDSLIIGTDGSVAVVTIADMRHDWLPSLLDAAPAAQRLAAALMAPPAAERRPPRPPTRLPARADWLHGLVAKLYPGDLEVVHNESWSPIGGGRVRGQVSVAARGAPGSGRGAAVLAPAQNGSRLKCTVTVDFKVPLLGGKIESFIGRQIVEQIAVVQHFTTKWITEHA